MNWSRAVGVDLNLKEENPNINNRKSLHPASESVRSNRDRDLISPHSILSHLFNRHITNDSILNMAPTSPIKRVTRARAAAKTDSTTAATKKAAATKVTKSTTTKASTSKPPTRKTQTKNEEVVEEPEEIEAPKKIVRATKAAPLPVAPRRRIKVTPLDAPVVDEPEPQVEVEKPKKKTSSRPKKAVEAEPAAEELKPAPAKTRSRSTKATSSTKQAPPAAETEKAASKTRIRPKKSTQPIDATIPEPVVPKTTRQTRARSASVASQQASDTIEVIEKPKTAARKKVTFQDLPEDEKENDLAPVRKAAAKKAAPATGMRARPVRKPTAATTTKPAATTRGRVAKPPVRALTPKKVTQVARVSTPDDSEDELNGAKTPVRDLSLSPKRNTNVAALLSSAKKLDFNQTLLARSPQKLSDGPNLLSPARRPASPAKNNDSQEDVQSDLPAKGAGLLQSPKRGITDTSIFPPSAIKAKRSPLKESLLQSPARRLFSPAKSKAPLNVHRDAENEDTMEAVEEIAISSHFRPSMSPQRSARVYKMTEEELADELAMDVDFDQSVLKLTSPKKSPVKPLKMTLTAVLDKEPQMSTIQNDAEETAKAVEELQGTDEDLADDVEEDVEPEETIEPAQMSLTTTDDSATEDELAAQRPSALSKAPRLSQILFRSNRFVADDESSEDELAADQTPDRAPRLFRSSLTGATNSKSRLSMTAQQSANQHIGFTPLATQMSGWLANSPEKTPAKSAKKQTRPSALFSPLAGQHVAGEIQIARQGTPQQHKSSPAFKTSISSRPSFGGSNMGSPEKSTFFAEQMASMNEESTNEIPAEEVDMFDVPEEFTTQSAIAAENEVLRSELEKQDEPTILTEQQEDDTVIVNKAPEELTTDLVNEVHASDTAILDFQELAHEAEDLVDGEESHESGSESVYGDENAPPTETLNLSVIEREATPEQQTLNLHVIEQNALHVEDPTLNLHVIEQNLEEEDTAMLPPARVNLADEQTLNLHVLEQNASELSPLAIPVTGKSVVDDEPTLNFKLLERISPAKSAAATPVQRMADDTTLNFNVLEEDFFEDGSARNLTPEGSPAPSASPAKVTDESDVITPRPIFAGPRFVNTVVSKVPLKPAADVSPIKMPKKRSRSMSMSRGQSPPKRPHLTPIGKQSARSISYPAGAQSPAPSPAQSTPGQVSFAIDDFGDSTLDGIEIPEDEMDFDVTQETGTPATIKSVKTLKSAAPTPARTPLKTVAQGILHGAVIYVEVHTSEGADASGVYVDLLTQMGARCVREWRWNPRASVHGGDDLTTTGKPGITHVVYKDGGKRTLEKVRDAKGEVICVGVRWVLE